VEAAVERAVADLGGLHILGFVATAMTDATARRLGTSPERYREAVADTVPLRRIGSPEDVAGVIAFLVGPTPPTSPARRSTSTAAVRADGVTWVAPACHPGDLWREGHVSPRWQALRGRHMMAVGGAMAAPGGRGGRRTEANA
jgi:hypothetical protein